MVTRTADAEWRGGLQTGTGKMKLGSGAYEGAYSFKSRFTDGTGTNPEELIAAAHSGCFSMAFSAGLEKNGTPPTRVHTTATVNFEKTAAGFAVTRIDLVTEAEVPGIEEAAFHQQAENAKRDCPISRLLAPGTEITLKASLIR
ncbi:MAG TPA: OsmC family protein [Micropepsaceae bacterium]|nr:OsmC family protein [Micropepsaceae bacterium]